MSKKEGQDLEEAEEMLRQLLSTPPPPLSQPPQAKHKMYSKKAMRRKKESMRPGAREEEFEDDPTEVGVQKPKRRVDSIPEIDLDAERALRDSLRPPGVPKADK